MLRRLEHFGPAFRYKSLVTGKWVEARYVAELDVIRARYGEFELIGEPEVREVREWVGFNPYRNPGER